MPENTSSPSSFSRIPETPNFPVVKILSILLSTAALAQAFVHRGQTRTDKDKGQIVFATTPALLVESSHPSEKPSPWGLLAGTAHRCQAPNHDPVLNVTEPK